MISLLWSFLLIVPATAAAVLGFLRWLRLKNLGTITEITTGSVAYDELTFGHILTWDKHCFYVHGKPVWLLSGEFHYWRLPDKARWKDVLLQYKAAGLNCIRIYFCWAYHSPDQGVYHFDGNRDVEYLLSLCEELELFVLAAPGPYICAETQAGGHPAWLVAMKEVRLRHSVTNLYRSFDPEYSKYCVEWFSAILPILGRHQITTKPKGCLLALQIENEQFETMGPLPVGLSDDMRVLCKAARDLGMTVPFFTNDAWEEGSFIARPDSYRIGGKPTFGIDLYAVFCPTSNPFASAIDGNKDIASWADWEPAGFMKSLDRVEQKVRGHGGGAASSPIFIPELQGGWFNHYTVKCTFDDVYNYYGEDFTKLVVDAAFSQGCTAFNIYMFYGGTNWGTLGDPDVYTSYDYSACLREFGHFSGRVRKFRLAIAFARSFAAEFLRTEPNEPTKASFLVTCATENFIAKQRRSVGPYSVYFVFFRNFTKNKVGSATISVARLHREPIQLKCKLGYKESAIGLGNYTTKNGLQLILATLPICVRTISPSGQEVWIVQSNDQKDGQLAFQGGLEIEGTLDTVFEKQDDATIVSFKKNSGWCKIQRAGDPASALIIVALDGIDLYSLYPVFREEHWSHQPSHYPSAVFWGAYQMNYDLVSKRLRVHHTDAAKTVYSLDSTSDRLAGFSAAPNTWPAFVSTRTVERSSPLAPPALPPIQFTESKRVDFKQLAWREIPLLPKSTRPSLTPIDLCYISGHVVYKLVFDLASVPAGGAKFDVNMRHRCAIIINNKSLGGHMTYALSSLKPGSKNGPDIGNIAGWKSYQLPASELTSGRNEVFCVIESLGLNRAPGPIDDIRSPRGLMDARIKGAASIQWFIAGVDVRTLSQVYNHTGIPDEAQAFSELSVPLSQIPKGVVSPAWFRGTFSYQPASDVKAPLRLSAHGDNMAYIFVNDILIGRYYGNGEGPQHDFFIPPDLLAKHAPNKLAVFTFGTSSESSIELGFKHWKFRGDASLILGSGNLDEAGEPFVLNVADLDC
ncbi:hypothetical protein HDU91_004803 [Kappamyces sp. JEL0680]|nr:hypothetical protein HDU91_004803 [Kappamyces sp. JEL0680]